VSSTADAAPGKGPRGELKMQESLAMLLKTHVEKMSTFRLATMLMKTQGLTLFCHDVDEKKGG
jgi:hypothetical protein